MQRDPRELCRPIIALLFGASIYNSARRRSLSLPLRVLHEEEVKPTQDIGKALVSFLAQKCYVRKLVIDYVHAYCKFKERTWV